MVAIFHHLGVPTSSEGKNELYIAEGKVYVTDPEESPYRIEYLRFETGSPMPDALQKEQHVAYMVKSIPEALEGREVVVEPFDATDELRVAFIRVDGALIEVMETR